jgi:hypothetical protein
VLRTIVNVEHFPLFGTGSEWFWTMAEFWALAVTFLFVYFQVRAQSAANTFNQMDSLTQEWDSDRMLRQRLALYEHLEQNGREGPSSHMLTGVANFCQNIAVLAGRGHIRRQIVYDWWGAVLLSHWLVCDVQVNQLRLRTGGRAIYGEWERVAVEFQEFNTRKDHPFGPMTIDSSQRAMRDSAERIRMLLQMAQVANTGSPPIDPATVEAR